MKFSMFALSSTFIFLLSTCPFSAHASFNAGYEGLGTLLIMFAILASVVTLAPVLLVSLRIYLLGKQNKSSVLPFLRAGSFIVGVPSFFWLIHFLFRDAVYDPIGTLTNPLVFIPLISVIIAAVGAFVSDQRLTRIFKE